MECVSSSEGAPWVEVSPSVRKRRKAKEAVTELRRLSPTSRSSPHDSVGLGCQSCPFLPDCGGVFSDYDCLGSCCGDPENCRIACPRSHHFGEVVQDSGGWNRRTPTLKQDHSRPFPLYIPCIQNGSQRAEPLSVPIAAVPTFRNSRCRAAAARFCRGVEGEIWVVARYAAHFALGQRRSRFRNLLGVFRLAVVTEIHCESRC